MKKAIICLYTLAMTISTFATGQDGDIIYIDGERWSLLLKPIDFDSIYLDLKAILPKDRSWSTANWDGYTGYWSIRDERLCLDSVTVEFYNKETRQNRQQRIDEASMRRVFKDYYMNDGIVATWLSANVRAAKGNKVYYRHTAYERNHEYEQILTIKNGKVIDRKSYHNQIVAEGFSLSDIKSQEDFKAKFPLHIEAYPELEGVNRIIFSIKEIRLDSLGNLLGCEVTAKVRHQQEEKLQNIDKLAQEMKTMLMNIHPWKTLRINGEYVAVDKNGYSLPYIINTKVSRP